MQFNVHYRPANTALQVELNDGDKVVAEAGSMICMNSLIDMETSTHQKNQKGGVLSSLKRMIGGESFFLNHYHAKSGNSGDVWLATTLPGDIIVQRLAGEQIIVQAGSFLACDADVTIDVGWQGFKSMFSGEGMFWLKAHGSGDLALSSFGTIFEVDVKDEYIVDTGHIVAFEETLDFSISKAGTSWIHSFLGGEGLVCRFKGTGKVWCQSHHQESFGQVLTPLLKKKKQ